METNLKTPLEPVPISEFFPPQPPPTTSQSPPPTLSRKQKNGKLYINARPSACDMFLMLPPCLFLGCCFAVSANVVFDDNTSSVYISNWPGLLCFPPCQKSEVIPYTEIANIGMQHTGGREGSDGHAQLIYDVMLVTRSGKLWRVGARGFSAEVSAQVEDLHYHVFGRNNPKYTRVKGSAQHIPTDDDCC